MGRFYIYCCSVCIHSCSINLSAFGSFPALSLHSHQTLLFSFCLPLSLSLARPPSLCRCFHAFLYSFVTVFSVPRSLPFHVVPPLVALVLLSFFHLPPSVCPSVHPSIPSIPPPLAFPRIFPFLVSFCSSLGRTAAPTFSQSLRHSRASNAVNEHIFRGRNRTSHLDSVEERSAESSARNSVLAHPQPRQRQKSPSSVPGPFTADAAAAPPATWSKLWRRRRPRQRCCAL